MQMDDTGYKGGPTVEGKWGCFIATLVGLPIFVFLLLGDVLGDCLPESECKKGFLTQVLLPSVAITLGTFLLARWAIKAARGNGS